MNATLTKPGKDAGRRGPKKMDSALEKLSDKERTVLKGILRDQTYPQIAHQMGLSHESVKTYASRLRAKLGINTKIGLALFAQKHEKDL